MVKFILTTIFAVLLVSGVIDNEVSGQQYTLLTLAQSWPQTTCWDLNKNWPAPGKTCNSCTVPNQGNSWTLHGLWPSNAKPPHPGFCNKNLQYNPKLFNGALRAQLNQHWPSFKRGTANDNFWAHEWNKHGTCAVNLQDTNTQPKYFSKSLQLLNSYNIGTILANHGIVPGVNAQYQFNQIVQAVRASLTSTVYVKCAVNPGTNNQYLVEINVCLNKAFQLTNCSPTTKTNCNQNQPIYYPKC